MKNKDLRINDAFIWIGEPRLYYTALVIVVHIDRNSDAAIWLRIHYDGTFSTHAGTWLSFENAPGFWKKI